MFHANSTVFHFLDFEEISHSITFIHGNFSMYKIAGSYPCL